MKKTPSRSPNSHQGDEVEWSAGSDCMGQNSLGPDCSGNPMRSDGLGQLRIDPNSLYRSHWLRTKLGKRCFEELRRAGLSKTGGWYLGKGVLEAMQKSLGDRRGSARTLQDEGNERKRSDRVDEESFKKRVGSRLSGRKIQPVSVNDHGKSLREQIDWYTRQTEKKVLGA